MNVYDELGRLNSELVNAQRELQKKTLALERLNEEKNRAMGIVAHDLRNPISLILMYSRYLLDATGGRLDEEERECLGTMHETAQSMTRLVQNVLDTSAIEAGQLNLEIADFDVGSLLHSVARRMRPMARQRRVRIDLRVPKDADLTLDGDAGKLEQVFCNVIDNAVKYSPDGDVVLVQTDVRNGSLQIEVADRGPGIPDDILPNLFRPFSGSSSTSKTRKAGTGLGLSIARRIVDAHGGTIEVRTPPERGARILIFLPKKT